MPVQLTRLVEAWMITGNGGLEMLNWNVPLGLLAKLDTVGGVGARTVTVVVAKSSDGFASGVPAVTSAKLMMEPAASSLSVTLRLVPVLVVSVPTLQSRLWPVRERVPWAALVPTMIEFNGKVSSTNILLDVDGP